MGTLVVVVIVVVAVVLMAAVLLGIRGQQHRHMHARREEAATLRDSARQHEMRGERERAAADRKAALARQAQAEADEKAALARTASIDARQRAEAADREGALAEEHVHRADTIDPDTAATDEARDDGAGDTQTATTYRPRQNSTGPRWRADLA